MQLGVERVQISESNPRFGECWPGDKSPSIQRLPDLRSLLPWYHREWSPVPGHYYTESRVVLVQSRDSLDWSRISGFIRRLSGLIRRVNRRVGPVPGNDNWLAYYIGFRWPKKARQSQGLQRRCYCCAHLYSRTLLHQQQKLEPYPAQPLISSVSTNTTVNSSEWFNSGWPSISNIAVKNYGENIIVELNPEVPPSILMFMFRI